MHQVCNSVFIHFLGNLHFVTVIVVIIEGGHRPVTHFYGLIELKTDQTARAQFEALKEKFQDDEVWESIQNNLSALVVDGASVNMGIVHIHLRMT